MSTFKSGISVIICCYNSAALLPETLNHLSKQVVPETIPWEIVIVNNASTDNTTDVAKSEGQKYSQFCGKFRIVIQDRAGLSYARKKGAEESIYKYLIFCDDDNWLNRSYLHKAYQIMESSENIGALGGKSSAVTDAPKFPDWFESLKNGYAVGKQCNEQGDVSEICALWGAGLVTRRNIFLKCFPKRYPSIMTGRKGLSMNSGEDTEFCMRLLLKGYKLFYDEGLSFVHFIPKDRLRTKYRIFPVPEYLSREALELKNYTLLRKLTKTRTIFKSLLITRIFLGYLSTFSGRKSWTLLDFKVIFYYYTYINRFRCHRQR
jgi:glycosyltransferase involved in cell wall biosynthesis